MISARADVVGSLLRPPWLLEAREAWAGGRLTAAAFKRIEDRAVDEAIALQEGAGLAVVTDGEQRRLSFQSQMTEAVEGFGPQTVVLGLVTTKSPRLETPAELGARIEEAARFVPRERLALSPQCGFATSVLGNRLSPEDQERKLRTVVETAQAVWGSA